MSDSESDNPAEIYEAANAMTLNLLPEKSRKIFCKYAHRRRGWNAPVWTIDGSAAAKCTYALDFRYHTIYWSTFRSEISPFPYQKNAKNFEGYKNPLDHSSIVLVSTLVLSQQCQ
ncbi:hypothetical protein PV327_005189 [Microctonus hyperodae]|uniref:Uncharacterized protein n=1 Tax=Microctonus hyperodae TaxID=165561 RepID=A0AA39G0W4_MICHY|nr:hypothetical protein PV327_005189 [Microctonus hyperodae]